MRRGLEIVVGLIGNFVVIRLSNSKRKPDATIVRHWTYSMYLQVHVSQKHDDKY